MKNIFKILVVFLLPLLLINACRDDADKNWSSPEASIKLYDTSLGSNTLYPTMADNVWKLVWDAPAGSGNFAVQFSKTADFQTPIAFATSATNNYSGKISDLNTALLQAGYSPYAQTLLYIRISRGAEVSNAITIGVTPYPVSVPVITSPTAGQSITLDAANPTAEAAKAVWTDYTYGVNVEYNVEIAPKGTTAFVSSGTTENVKELSWTNFDLNDAVLKMGGVVGAFSDVDVRVTATTNSAGGTITKTSSVVSFKVKPYQPAFVPFYIVGGATTVQWNPANAQLLYANNAIAEMYAYLNNNGEFRFLGQQAWNPLNYSLNAPGIKDSYKYFKTWSSNLEASGDENIKFTGNSGLYKITIDQNARSINVTPSSIPTMPTELYLVGSLNGWDAGNALPMTQVENGVYEYSIAIPDNAEFKFLGQKSWGDLEWANIHNSGNSGFLGPKGDNDNIKFNGGGAMYKITANIALGTYKVTPL